MVVHCIFNQVPLGNILNLSELKPLPVVSLTSCLRCWTSEWKVWSSVLDGFMETSFG